VSEEQAKKLLVKLENIEACLLFIVSALLGGAVTAVFFW